MRGTSGHSEASELGDPTIARARAVASGSRWQHQSDVGRDDAAIGLDNSASRGRARDDGPDIEQQGTRVGCEEGSMADSECSERRKTGERRKDVVDGRNNGREETSGGSSVHSEESGMADAQSECGHGTVRARNGHARPADDGTSRRLDDTQRAGLEIRSGELPHSGASEGTSATAIAPGTPGPCNGFWSDAEWIPTRGKVPGTIDWRAIKPRSRALDDGAATDFLRMCDYGFPLVAKSEARTLRIRGYGDGIVAQVAAEFIKAYMSL